MKDITPIMKSLGLLDSEIKTYLAALEKGARTVLDLAKDTRLSRQAVYVAIEALVERGLVSSSIHGKKRFFSAEHPDTLLAYAKRRETEMKERISDLERVLPELELQVGGEKPVVKLFEGKEGVMSIIHDIASSQSDEIQEIADATAMHAMISREEVVTMLQELKKQDVHVTGLYAGPMSPNGTLPSDRYQLPAEFADFKSNITIYDKNKVALVVFTGKMHAILIESEPLAKILRVLFSLSLRTAKKDFPKI